MWHVVLSEFDSGFCSIQITLMCSLLRGLYALWPAGRDVELGYMPIFSAFAPFEFGSSVHTLVWGTFSYSDVVWSISLNSRRNSFNAI